MRIALSAIDYAMVLTYFVFVIAIGWLLKRYMRASADFLTSDRSLPPLFAALAHRGPALCLLMSDHGTAYGEDGYYGHRLAHDVVWTVPYSEFVLPAAAKGQP